MLTMKLQRIILFGASLAIAWVWWAAYQGIQASMAAGPHLQGTWLLEDSTQPMRLLPGAAALKAARYATYTPHLIDAGSIIKGQAGQTRAFTVHLAPAVTRLEAQAQAGRLAQQYLSAVAEQQINVRLIFLRYLGIALLPLPALAGLCYLMTLWRRAKVVDPMLTSA